MVEEVSTTLNAVVACVGCQLSFMLTNVYSHESFEAIISATEDHTVYIPINTFCDKCYSDWKYYRKCDPLYIANIKIKAGNVAATLLRDIITHSETIALASQDIQSILKERTEVAELQVERGSTGLVVTKTPYVSGRMLLRIYGEP